jgi:hypothetical protein
MLLYEFISFQQLMLIFLWFLEFYSVAACALIKTNEENPPPVEEDLFEQSRERPVMK